MNWSQAKTILIITFLLLNAFLIFQLRELNHASQINMIEETTIQERLNDMNITIKATYEEEKMSGKHIVSRHKKITEEQIRKLENQTVTIEKDDKIVSILDEPVPLNIEADLNIQLNQFLATYVLEKNQYQFVRYDELKQQITFMPKYEDKVMYSYNVAPLILHLDKDNRIISYEQAILEVEEHGRPQEFLTSLNAIEILLNEKLLKGNEEIVAIELGYYSFFQPLGTVQVFAPMWRITVDDEYFLVNAIDGSIQDVS